MSRIPDRGRRLVNSDGDLTDSARLWLNQLQGIIDGTFNIINVTFDYDSLALLNEAIPNPVNNSHVTVNGQGLARFKASLGPSGAWVLAADDTTLIT